MAEAVLVDGKWKTAKKDAIGRTLDVHCLRTTFNSLLAAASVPLTTRRILMRQAARTVTDEHYTDVKLLDRGASWTSYLSSMPRRTKNRWRRARTAGSGLLSGLLCG